MNRRNLIGLSTGLALAATRVGATSASEGSTMAEVPNAGSAAPPNPLFPDDIEFWFETLRGFGAADYGGAEFGEVLSTSRLIQPGDYDGWYAAWHATAERVAAEGRRQLSRGHRVSARDSLLRASNYHRNSEFFLHGYPSDPRINEAYRATVACYKTACGLFDPAIEPVEIPYGTYTLPGYFHRAGGAADRKPTIVMHTGFDGSAEEMHFGNARAAVERGYNVLAFDGPGQFGPIHRDGLTMRPDWEHVVTPVVDFTLARSDVDPKRLVLFGNSLGGELAPRAAAFEHRFAALIANDGLYDFGAPVLQRVPAAQREAFTEALRAPSAPKVDATLATLMKTSSILRWAVTHGMYVTGTATPRAYIAASLAYNLRGGVAEQIRCPTLVCAAEADEFFKGQPEELYAHLTCPKTLLPFTVAEGAGDHCQEGARRLSAARIFDWLDELLASGASSPR